ncbi:hypothetical protein BHM03_00034027 [Ensete ventricosum]|nr:hypothetical protein BHM03_00034027 [Ensete ventricosum]
MGNCAPKPKPKPRSRPAQHSSSLLKPDVPAVRLYGPESCPISSCLRLALLYKSVPFQFVPQSPLLGLPFLQCGADTVVGAAETLLRELDSRFPRPPAAATALADTTSAAEEVALVTALQHRSVERHVEELARWVTATAAGGGGGKGEAARMERSYGQLAEVVLEHAQMEERLLFPAFESAADRGTPSSPVHWDKIKGIITGVCKVANEEHARDLPIINGIKEDIKSMAVMEAGTPFHQEALLNLSLRLKTLEEHFKGHFQEEEKNLLPQLEMAMRSQREEEEDESSSRSWMEQVLVLMEATHSPRLFPFFMAGLLPDEAMQYVGLVRRQTADQQRLASMLRSLITVLEAKQSIVGHLRRPT